MVPAQRFRDAFGEFLREGSHDSSNKAASYLRALDLLGPILARRAPVHLQIADVWAVGSPTTCRALYSYVREQQRLGKAGIFADEEPCSYWRDGFMSAALKGYVEFLVLSNHEDGLWLMLQDANGSPQEISRRLEELPVESIEELVAEQAADLDSWAGREVLRQARMRIKQHFFRRMILSTYGGSCCLTGLAVPELLIASHIVPWAADPGNRLNPQNGLCLNALHDKAFDRGLIALDDQFRLLVSDRLAEHFEGEIVQNNFVAYQGRPIHLPQRFAPDQEFLARHRRTWGFG